MRTIWDIRVLLVVGLFLIAATCQFSHLFAAVDFSTRSFRTITSSDGLCSNIINTIYKDKRGFLWLGTQTGLNRFDGIDVISYPQLTGRSILSVCESDSVDLWVGTDKGLVRLDRVHGTCYPVSLNYQALRINVICPDRQYGLLLGTDRGLFIWKDGKINRVVFGSDASSSSNHITDIVEGGKGIFWLTSYNGLVRYDIRNDKSSVFMSSSNNSLSCLVRKDDILYVGTRGSGLQKFDMNGNRFIPYACPDFEHGDVKALASVDGNTLYIGTNGNGIQIMNMHTGRKDAVIEHELSSDALCSNAIYSLCISDDVLFAGTYMGGLSYTPSCRNLFSVYRWKDVFNSFGLNVRAFWIDEKKGKKIIGTRDGLYYISEREDLLKHYTRKNSILRSDIILSVIPFKEDYLIGTYGGGLYRLSSSSGRLSFFKKEECFLEGSFNGYTRDNKGQLWIGSSNGVYVLDEATGRYDHYDSKNSSLSFNSIFSIKTDSENRIWIGTYGTLFLYNPVTGVFTSSIFPDSISAYTSSIRYIYEDAEQNLWFCDDLEGVTKVCANLTQCEHYTFQNFLPSNSVMSIVESPSKDGLWFATQGGLLYWDKQGRNYTHFSMYDGLPGYVFNHPVQITQDNKVWWGNEKGLVCCSVPFLKENEGHTQFPAITSVTVSGRKLFPEIDVMPVSQSFAGQINVLPDENNVTFTFSPLIYAKEDAMLYEYRLQGIDADWQILFRGNQVAYTNLPAGEFLFQIRSTSFPEVIQTMKVIVQKQYASVFWLLILVCLLVCFVWIFPYSRLRRKYFQLKRREKRQADITLAEKEKYQKSKIEDAVAASIYEQLRTCMEKEQLYLNSELKLQDVAEVIGCSAGEISQTLNVFMDTNFADFVNQYRIEEFILLVQKDASQKYTLSSLSEQCGFSSRTSFFRSFKKQKGMTPAEYIKDYNNKSR